MNATEARHHHPGCRESSLDIVTASTQIGWVSKLQAYPRTENDSAETATTPESLPRLKFTFHKEHEPVTLLADA